MWSKRKEILALTLAMLPVVVFGLGACSIARVHITDKTPDGTDTDQQLQTEIDGQMQYNLPLIKQTIQNWFGETDYYTVDLKKNRVDASLDEIVYFNFNAEKSQNEFGAYVTEDNHKRFQTFRFKSDLDNAFNDGNIKSVKDLINYLDENRDKRPIVTVGAPISVEQSVTQQDLEGIWPRVKERLEKFGVQDSIYEVSETTMTDQFKNFELVDVYDSFVGEVHGTDIGHDMGSITIYNSRFFVKNVYSDEKKLVRVTVVGKNPHAVDNILNGKDLSWLIASYDEKDITMVDYIEDCLQ